MIQKKSDDAVSPVIGVMLMIVITVVIAGVVAAFGTGMTGDMEPAPNVVLDIKIMSNFGALSSDQTGDLRGPDFQILHVSGDPLDTGDIEIQIAWIDQDGKSHYSTYSAAEYKSKHGMNWGSRYQPMYVKMQVPYTGADYTYGSMNLDYYFGDVVLTPGLRATATTDFLALGKNNVGSPFMDAIFCSSGEIKTSDSVTDPGIMKYLPAGTPVEITILHIPSNTIIYEKEVVVQ